MVTGFPVRSRVFTIDGFSQYPCTSGFTHSSGTTEQKSMGQLVILNGIFKGGGNMRLAYNGRKILWSVFPCRYDEFVHDIEPEIRGLVLLSADSDYAIIIKF